MKNNVGKVVGVAILLLTFTVGCGTTNTASQNNTVAVTTTNNSADNSSLLDTSGDLTNLLNKRADGLVKDNTGVAESVTGKGGNGSSSPDTKTNNSSGGSSGNSSKTSTNPNVSSGSSETHVVSANHSSSNSGSGSGSSYSESHSSSGGNVSSGSGSHSSGTGQAPAGSYTAYGTSVFGQEKAFVAPTYAEAQAEVTQWQLSTDKEYMIQQGWSSLDVTINGVAYHLTNPNASSNSNNAS